LLTPGSSLDEGTKVPKSEVPALNPPYNVEITTKFGTTNYQVELNTGATYNDLKEALKAKNLKDVNLEVMEVFAKDGDKIKWFRLTENASVLDKAIVLAKKQENTIKIKPMGLKKTKEGKD